MSLAREWKCGGVVQELRLGFVGAGETWDKAGALTNIVPYMGWWPVKIVGDAPMGRTGVKIRRLVRRVKEDVERVLCWVLC